MSTTPSCTSNVKTDGGNLADLVQQHSLDWQFTLHNDWNTHRLVALCVACFPLIGNANERVHAIPQLFALSARQRIAQHQLCVRPRSNPKTAIYSPGSYTSPDNYTYQLDSGLQFKPERGSATTDAKSVCSVSSCRSDSAHRYCTG